MGSGDAAEDRLGRAELVHLGAEDPEEDVGDDDRQADRHQRLAQVLALHVAEHRDLQHQAHEGGRGEARRHREQPRARLVAHDVAHVGAEQIERAVGEVHVLHQAEDQREAARHDEVERGERDAVQRGEEEELRVVEERPDGERGHRRPERGDDPGPPGARRPRRVGDAAVAGWRSCRHRPARGARRDFRRLVELPVLHDREQARCGRAGSRGWRADRRRPAAGRRARPASRGPARPASS